MNKRQITIYASSVINGNAQMEISFEQLTRDGETHDFYRVIYTQGNKPMKLYKRANEFIDYLFDNLWYNKPLDEMENAIQLKYEAYAELLSMYFQINLFDFCLTFDSFSYELIGK